MQKNETIDEVIAELTRVFNGQHGICTWTYRKFIDALEKMKSEQK